jgi:hypothetical protein
LILFFPLSFLLVLEFEHKASYLRGSNAWAMPPAPFALFFWGIGTYFLSRLTWIVILLFYTSHCHWDDSHTPPCPLFFLWDGLMSFFYLGWPGNVILSISASCIAWDNRCAPLCQAIGWDGVLITFYLGWP